MANKQSTVSTRGRNRLGARGSTRGRARSASRARAQDSATPSAPESRIVKLKGVDFGRLTEPLQSEIFTQAAAGAEQEDQDEDEVPVEDEELPTQPFVTGHLEDLFNGEPPGQTTRAGRQVRAPKEYQDTVYLDSDMVEPSSVGKVEEDDEGGEYQEPAPKFLNLDPKSPPKPKNRPGRPRNPPKAAAPPRQPPFPNHIGGHHASSSTLAPSSPPRATTVLRVDPHTYEILHYLTAQSSPPVSLPELEMPGNPNAEEPYSAKFLTELYMIAYAAGSWNTCDLVADTWLRMFHRLRRRATTPETAIWRTNHALNKWKKKTGRAGFDANPPSFGEKLSIDDPALHADASAYDRELLGRLYMHTHPSCGARLLWADSMALSGTRVAQMMAREEWHADLVQNVLCTTLRLVRRKLTLKCEEGTEGAWCRRYHEHGKRGLKCYREVAAEMGVGEEEGAASASRKHGRGGVDANDGGDRGKRARVEREIVDVEAEGESE